MVSTQVPIIAPARHDKEDCDVKQGRFCLQILPRNIPLWKSLPRNLIDQLSLEDFRNLLNNIDFN